MGKIKKWEFENEYHNYMKRVTDSFVEMQSDKVIGTIGHDKDSVFYEVVWKGGLEWKFDLNCNLYITGCTFEEMKKHNAKIALEYLKENSLTYEIWFKKYKS